MQVTYQREEDRRVKTLTVLTPRLIRRLDELAARSVTSRSALIRMACEQLLGDTEPLNGAGRSSVVTA